MENALGLLSEEYQRFTVLSKQSLKISNSSQQPRNLSIDGSSSIRQNIDSLYTAAKHMSGRACTVGRVGAVSGLY